MLKIVKKSQIITQCIGLAKPQNKRGHHCWQPHIVDYQVCLFKTATLFFRFDYQHLPLIIDFNFSEPSKHALAKQ